MLILRLLLLLLLLLLLCLHHRHLLQQLAVALELIQELLAQLADSVDPEQRASIEQLEASLVPPVPPPTPRVKLLEEEASAAS